MFVDRSVDGGTDESVEDDAGNDEVGSSPAVQTEQQWHERRQHERADAWAAHGDARRQRSTLVEVVTNDDDRRQIHETESHSFVHNTKQKKT